MKLPNYPNLKKTYFVLIIIGIFGNYTWAQNPIVTHMYTADPTARVFNDKLYVYPSHDVEVCNEVQGSNGFCMPDYHMFSTDDLVNWKDHGVIMDQNEVPWGAKNRYGMWAPDCIYKDGTYYYYYPGIPADKSAFRRIGVATSKSPTGPFKQVNHYIKGIQGIDPGLFVDDDGKAYLYYGGGKGKGALKAVRLKNNMVEIDGQPKDVEGIVYEGYREASFLFKRKGLYYFTYARVGDNNYQIEYATAKNPMGPFTYRGVAMENIANGTNHHSFVEYRGKWYLFYHDWSISGNNRLRSMCVDEMKFNRDGTIALVKPTLRGIGTPKAGDIIQIDRHNGIQNAKVATVKGNQPRGFQVEKIQNGGWVKFDRVNFGKGNLEDIKVRAASAGSGGTLELRTNTKDGELLAKIPIKNTGSWTTWKTFTSKFIATTRGVKDIVCVFKGEGENLFNVNWIKFSSTDVPGSESILPYELEGAPPKAVKNKLSKEELAKLPKKRGKGTAKIGEVLQIDEHSGISYARISPTQSPQPKGFQIGHIKNNGWVKYDRVDFGTGNLKEFKALVSAGEKGGTLELRIDAIDGPVLASIDVPNTGGWNAWKLLSSTFAGQVTGIKNIVCTFKGEGNNLFNLNWIRITSSDVPESLKKHPLEEGYDDNGTQGKHKKPKNKVIKAQEVIQIDEHDGIDKARIIPANDGGQVGYIKHGGWLQYNNVDFGAGKIKSVEGYVSSGTKGGVLEIRINSKIGPILASLDISNTGGWKNWKTVSSAIKQKITGVKDIYCLFKGSSEGYLYNVNWLRFSENAIATIPTIANNQNIPIPETKADKRKRLRDIEKGEELGLPLGRILAIKAQNGKYLTIMGKAIMATADAIGEKERFVVLSATEKTVAIKSMFSNTYFSIQLDKNNVPVWASKTDDITGTEAFIWRKIQAQQFSLIARNNSAVHISADQKNILTANDGATFDKNATFSFEIIE